MKGREGRATREERMALVELSWQGDVAVVRLNDPATLNAVSVPMIEALSAALDEVEAKARAMVLTGTGKGFCSGANLSASNDSREKNEASGPGGRDYDPGKALETHINPLVLRLTQLACPWVTAVNGAAAGVGASFALLGDMVVASDQAYFLQAFAKVGLVPDGGSSHLLVRTVGRVRAMELMLLADRLPAAKAMEWGLVNRVVAADGLMDEALHLAGRLGSGAASLKSIRKLAWAAVDGGFDASLKAEREAQREVGQTADHREGVMAFVQKRPAQFSGQ